MTVQLSRRSLITGLVSLVASPAIVRVANIMPVKAMTLWEDPEAGITTFEITSELYLVTRRAFVPRLYVQIWIANPMITILQEIEAGAGA